MTIAQIVATHLAGQSVVYLEDVAAHGIHNITNDFQGDTDEEYDAFTNEFKRQADSLLDDIENAARAERRADVC